MSPSFSIIPVLDIKGGVAVHAIAGLRDSYQPLKTILHQGSRPIDVARSYRDRLGLSTLYLADLDAIAGQPPNTRLYDALLDEGLDLWLDAGLRDREQAEGLCQRCGVSLVIGLESIQGPEEAVAILDRLGPDRVIFSVDQSQGLLLTASPDAWTARTAIEMADALQALGFTRLLFLDLARVGTGRGTGTDVLLQQLRPLLGDGPRQLFVGGGVSGLADLQHLKAEGASGVLVGSVLHDGRVRRSELATLMLKPPTTG